MKRVFITALLAVFTVMSLNIIKAETAEEIIKKNSTARGGERAFASIKSYKFDMTANQMGQEVKMNVFREIPGRQRIDIVMDQGGQKMNISIAMVNDSTGWINQFGQVSDIPKEQMSNIKKSLGSQTGLFENLVSRNMSDVEKLELLPNEKFENKDYYKIKATKKDSTIVTVLIDTKTYFEKKLIQKQDIQGQLIDVEVVVSDDKKVGDITIPHKYVMQEVGGEPFAEITFEKIEFNTKPDASLFDKPQGK